MIENFATRDRFVPYDNVLTDNLQVDDDYRGTDNGIMSSHRMANSRNMKLNEKSLIFKGDMSLDNKIIS